jgi:cysteinyl-tRNA synthetase
VRVPVLARQTTYRARTLRRVVLHDTRSGRTVPLEPRDAGKVGIYVCGPTVYGRVHVGNARPYVVFSQLKRFLEHEGLEVTLVSNVTDVNDKIYAAARAAGRPSDELAVEMTEHYRRDTDRLGLGRPDQEPLATETMPEIVELIGALLERGHAYVAEGDVYFRVRSLDAYGDLSHRDVDHMDQGEGVEGSDRKEDALDFALWKAAKEGEDTSWEAPWGRGRPGWHIECSAMAETLLGPEFDIHGGGIDLVFPHHENEAAQTLAARGRPLARIWAHNGMLQLEEKMSKSVGNVVGLAEALDEWGSDALLMYFAGGHYRQPIAYSPEPLEQARANVRRVRDAAVEPGGSPADLEIHRDGFFDALAEDFNTPKALASLWAWVGEANRRGGAGDAHLREMLEVLGLAHLLEVQEAPGEVRDLAERRSRARAARDFAEADRLREELRELGWEVRDSAAGAELVPVQ